MLNNVCLQGNLGADPELKTSQSGVAVVSIRIAVKRSRKDADGNYKTDWITCVAFRQTAEFICKYFKKGDTIIINGELRSGEYTDKNGNKAYKTEVFVEGVNFGGSKRSAEPSAPSSEAPVPPPEPALEQTDTDDDYPF